MADTKGKASTSTRSLWKGAITFGLVHIPIGLYSATQESDIDFDWLDKRTLDPVGYKRINKRTGREVAKDDIVKGVAHAPGEYVVLSPEEIAEAYPRTTQTIDIETFVDLDELPFVYLEKPYYTAPINKGEKVYALLREALRESGKAAIGRVVIRSKQHLAVVLPCGPALVLNLLRWGGEIRSWEGLGLPPQGKAAGLREAELKMAKQLIDDMSGHWRASEFRDEFRDAILALVEAKARAGDTTAVEPLEEAPAAQGAEVIDLTELLRRSLRGDAAAPAAAPAKPAEKAAKPAAKRKTATASRSRTASNEPERAAASAGSTRKRKAPAAKAPAARSTGTRARRAA